MKKMIAVSNCEEVEIPPLFKAFQDVKTRHQCLEGERWHNGVSVKCILVIEIFPTGKISLKGAKGGYLGVYEKDHKGELQEISLEGDFLGALQKIFRGEALVL